MKKLALIVFLLLSACEGSEDFFIWEDRDLINAEMEKRGYVLDRSKNILYKNGVMIVFFDMRYCGRGCYIDQTQFQGPDEAEYSVIRDFNIAFVESVKAAETSYLGSLGVEKIEQKVEE